MPVSRQKTNNARYVQGDGHSKAYQLIGNAVNEDADRRSEVRWSKLAGKTWPLINSVTCKLLPTITCRCIISNTTLHTSTWHRFHKKQSSSALTDGVLPVRTHLTRAMPSSTPTLPGWTSSPRMAAESPRAILSSRPRRSPSVFPRV
jgi:hypothetical protein